MKLLDRMKQVRGGGQRQPPIAPPSASWGGRSEYDPPPEYGDYLVTSDDVYSVANFRARKMSSVPLRTYTGTGVERELVLAGPVVDLLRHVNPFWTQERLRRMDELAMCLWGQSFWAIERDRRGVPAEIWWLKPTQVRPVPDSQGYLRGFIYEVPGSGQTIPLSTDEVVWFRYPNPLDEFAPLAPLSAARLAADTSKAMQRTNYSLFRNGLQAGAIVTPPSGVTYSAEEAQKLLDDLEDRLQGADKAHRWAVLRFAASLSTIDVTPEDAQFVEGLTITFRRLCSVYGVPSPLLNDLAESTKANLQGLQQSLWEDTLVPDLQFKAAEVNEQLLPMFRRQGATVPDHVEFDVSNVPALRQAQSETWDRDRGRIEVGAITVNEYRATAGLPDVPWGNRWWAPVNKAQVDPNTGEVVAAGLTQVDMDEDGAGPRADPEQIARLVQQLYLGTPERAVLTMNEARGVLNTAGANLGPVDPEELDPEATEAVADSVEVPDDDDT